MRKKLAVAAACVALASLLAGYAATISGVAGQTKTNVAVRRGDLAVSVVTTGNLSLPHQVDLNFAITGILKEVLVAKGDRVKKGQALARLDDTSFRDAVQRQQLQLQQDQKSLELARLDARRANEQLEEAGIGAPGSVTYTFYPDLPTVRRNVATALQKLDEIETRIRSGQLDMATSEVNYATDYLNAALKAANVTQFVSIDLRGSSVGAGIATVRNLTYLRDRAQVAADKAQVTVDTSSLALDLAKKDLAKTVLAAPFEGVISDVSKLDDGSSVTTSTKIFHLVDTAQAEMNGQMMQLDIAGVTTGQEVVVTLDALPDVKLKGRVTFISPTASSTSGVVSYPITVTLEPQTGSAPRDGMTATASILVGQRSGVLLMPRKAVVSLVSGQDAMVEVVVDQRSGRTEQRRVTVGLSGTDSVEVVSGLKEGDLVVVTS